MSKLWTFGCSYTAEYHPVQSINANGTKNNYTLYREWLGGTLPDIWPTRLSKMLGMEVENKGMGGASNDHIFGEFCDNCEFISKGDIVIVGWTQISRFRAAVYDERGLPKFMSVLPNMTTNVDTTSFMTTDVLDFLLVERTDRLYVEEIYFREDVMEELSKFKGFDIFFWSSDSEVIYNEPSNFKNKRRYLCSDSVDDTITHLIRKKGAKKIEVETKGEVKDVHFGEIGHQIQAEVFYKEISEKLKPKLI
jgi:hypothetical protein